MKKINLKTSAWALALLLITIVIYSCKRDSNEGMAQLNQALIGNAKQFYQRETINFEYRNRYVLSSEKTGSNIGGNVNVNPIWDEAVIEKTSSGKKLVTVPLPQFSLGTKTSAYARKMIFETQGGTIKEGQIVEVFSTPMEIGNNGEKRLREASDENLSGFTGAVMTYNLSYVYKQGRYYENGRARKGIAKIAKKNTLLKGQLSLPGSGNSSGGIGKLSVTQGSISAITPEFEGQDCENYYLVYIERDEFGNVVYWENRGFQYRICQSTNPGSPNPGGSNTDIYADCNRDVNGYAYTDSCQICVGGNTGLQPCTEIKDLLDSFPCAKNLVAQMKGLKGDIAGKIKALFNKNDKIDLIFQPDPSLKNTLVDGHFLGYTGTSSGSTGTYRVGMNPDVLNNASKEYILVTLYHEALHAYLDHKKRILGDAEFSVQFSGYNVNGGRLLMSQDPNHWPLSYTNFINGLRDVILEFNPSYDMTRATALAKGGIINLTTSEGLVNKQERNTNDPLNNPGYTGTKCP